MSVHASGSGVATRLVPAKPKTLGFLHIERYGGGPNSLYIVTYRRLDHAAGGEAAGGGLADASGAPQAGPGRKRQCLN